MQKSSSSKRQPSTSWSACLCSECWGEPPWRLLGQHVIADLKKVISASIISISCCNAAHPNKLQDFHIVFHHGKDHFIASKPAPPRAPS